MLFAHRVRIGVRVRVRVTWPSHTATSAVSCSSAATSAPYTALRLGSSQLSPRHAGRSSSVAGRMWNDGSSPARCVRYLG